MTTRKKIAPTVEVETTEPVEEVTLEVIDSGYRVTVPYETWMNYDPAIAACYKRIK